MSDNTSIFTAELTALEKAIEIISTLQGSNFTVYSDSNSALLAIKQYNSSHPIVQRIQVGLFKLSFRSKNVQFCWVPSHVGIQGNEFADREAKAAICKDISFYQVPASDMKWPIRKYIREKWQARWSDPLMNNNKKYKAIRQSVDRWHSSHNSNRKVEVVLSRLRIGHTRLTHQYILEGGGAPVCARCDSILSVEHILVHCTRFDAQRRRFNLHNKNIAGILDDEADIEALFGFLKATNVLNLI